MAVDLSGNTRVEHRWWWVAATDRDMYELFVVEYTFTNDKPSRIVRNLDRFGIWQETVVGSTLVPCLSISGLLVHTLGAEGALEVNRTKIAETFVELSKRLLGGFETG